MAAGEAKEQRQGKGERERRIEKITQVCLRVCVCTVPSILTHSNSQIVLNPYSAHCPLRSHEICLYFQLPVSSKFPYIFPGNPLFLPLVWVYLSYSLGALARRPAQGTLPILQNKLKVWLLQEVPPPLGVFLSPSDTSTPPLPFFYRHSVNTCSLMESSNFRAPISNFTIWSWTIFISVILCSGKSMLPSIISLSWEMSICQALGWALGMVQMKFLILAL